MRIVNEVTEEALLSGNELRRTVTRHYAIEIFLNTRSL